LPPFSSPLAPLLAGEGDERCLLPSWNEEERLDGIVSAVAGV
jgi:hypothetical protein